MQRGDVRLLGTLRWSAALTWWNGKRLTYNVALIASGIIAFGLYAVAFELWAPRNDPDMEITAFTTVFQGFAYCLCMAAANVLFFLGPAIEQVIPEGSVATYRRLAFDAGFTVSVLLPMLVPALFYLEYGLGR